MNIVLSSDVRAINFTPMIKLVSLLRVPRSSMFLRMCIMSQLCIQRSCHAVP